VLLGQIDTHQGLVAVFDQKYGQLKALMDASRITGTTELAAASSQ
jgi:ornithine cyclodeaminase/alanine dehydrogenase-like protein (mu-crystallin family)